jgi:3-phenylpropionate/trans-cinnamate dioxygenase ferredoxin reductase component
MPDGTSTKPMVIVGGGKAGGTAAATFREEGFAGPVVIIGREPGIPFGRPPLSKTYLRSEEDLEGWYVKPADWYEAHDVELRTGSSVVAVDAAAHSVVLDSGQELEYQKVLLTSGGQNRRLRIPGPNCPGSTTCARRPSATRSSTKPWRAGARWWWAWGSSAPRWQPH